jgi:DNA polymerase-1
MAELLLIDASGFLWRCFHALPERRRADGRAVHAVEGFLGIVLRPVLERNRSTHVAVVFEAGGRTFRHDLYPGYKAHRPPPPPDLPPQMPIAMDAVRAFGLEAVAVPGVEADDVLATLARRGVEAGARVVVATQDKDLMQIVGPGVRLYDQRARKVVREADVEAVFGVPPSRVVDVQALAGDAADGIPGVPGVGMKTAAELVRALGPLERILSALHLVGRPTLRRRLAEHAEQARLSRRLAELRTDVDLDLPLEALRRPARAPDPRPFLRAQGLPERLAPRI